MKLLIVNADDFGFTRDVNEGIVHAHRQGILTASTLMATGPAFEHAVDLARASGVTLVAFLRGASMNIYTHPERIVADGQG